MAKTLLLKGAVGDHYVKPESIESLVIEIMTPSGKYIVRVRTVSGLELSAYFKTEQDQFEFVSKWAGPVTDLS
jgi:hypothetical protein